MTSEIRTAKSAHAPRAPISIRPLNLPTAEQIRRNRVAICRDQIIGAVKSGKDESLDYWLARYVDLVRPAGSSGQDGRRAQRVPRARP